MPNSLVAEQNWLEFHISTDKAVNIEMNLDLFAWVSFFLLILELYLDVAFHLVCDYT